MGIKEILINAIQVVESTVSWESAVEIAAMPLVKMNKIKSGYIKNMIQNIKTLGPYIILSPGVAMPHARPDENVLESSLSLLKVNKGIKFSDNTEMVYLIFCLAAKDSNSHIEILTELSNLLEDEEKIKMLIDSNTIEELNNNL